MVRSLGRRIARGLWRRVRRLVSADGLILHYHRVAPCQADPQRLAVAPWTFHEQLRAVRERWEIVPLVDLVTQPAARGAPPRVAVTLDDGYADNLYHAAPILQALRLPATVFVVGGHVGTPAFYWDALERMVLRHPRPPEIIEVELSGRRRRWRLSGREGRDPLLPGQEDGWHVECDTDPGPRHRAYRELVAGLRSVPDRQRTAVLEVLAEQFPALEADQAAGRPLRADELRALAACEGITIGAHTARHPRLSALPAAEQRREIMGGRRILEGLLDRPVLTFAYPYGQREDYDRTSVRLVREEGFLLACSSFPGRVRVGGDRFELPRLLVRGWDPHELLARIRHV